MNASNFVDGVDFSLYFILAISVFFLVGITSVMIYFLIRYRKKKNPVATNIEGNNTLEIIWTVIPTILVLLMFYYGWTGYKPMLNPPEDAMEVEAIGQMWKWSFKYPNGKVADTLVVPLNQAVKLNLTSKDVIHSLYIPAFRIKQDVVPGGSNFMWFIPQQTGKFDILCAEYCGQLHSYMLSAVKVVEKEAYEKWLKSSDVDKNEHPGLDLMKKNACLSCHSLTGKRIVGPSFKGLFGSVERVLIVNKEKDITVDRDYLRQSILKPNEAIVVGYPANVMTPYEGVLNSDEIDLIIDYIKTLK